MSFDAVAVTAGSSLSNPLSRPRDRYGAKCCPGGDRSCHLVILLTVVEPSITIAFFVAGAAYLISPMAIGMRTGTESSLTRRWSGVDLNL